tara:strand:+ start:2249 stop:2947 length:699 start_codon:yes stop_codon:yes gene_type:complete
MKILGIIPARAGSQGVKNKNIREFANSNLTEIAINHALGSKLIDKIILSTDSEKISRVAKKYSNVTTLNRPKEISKNDSPAISYMQHSLKYCHENKFYPDLVTIIQPTSPIRCSDDIDSSIKLLKSNIDADSSVSIVELPHMIHPYKFKTLKNKLLHPFSIDEKNNTSKHQLPKIYIRNCAVYVFKTINILNGITLGDKSLGYLMPPETAVDINSIMDFHFAEFLYKKINDL